MKIELHEVEGYNEFYGYIMNKYQMNLLSPINRNSIVAEVKHFLNGKIYEGTIKKYNSVTDESTDVEISNGVLNICSYGIEDYKFNHS